MAQSAQPPNGVHLGGKGIQTSDQSQRGSFRDQGESGRGRRDGGAGLLPTTVQEEWRRQPCSHGLHAPSPHLSTCSFPSGASGQALWLHTGLSLRQTWVAGCTAGKAHLGH